MGFSWYRLNVSETRFTDSPIARPKPEFSLSSSRGVVRGIAEAEKGKGDVAVPTARLATLYANPEYSRRRMQIGDHRPMVVK